jgi:hypothetical protein
MGAGGIVPQGPSALLRVGTSHPCLRAVPASTNFATSGGQQRAKEARYDESWKYIEENCTLGNAAAAVCAKHGERGPIPGKLSPPSRV